MAITYDQAAQNKDQLDAPDKARRRSEIFDLEQMIDFHLEKGKFSFGTRMSITAEQQKTIEEVYGELGWFVYFGNHEPYTNHMLHFSKKGKD